MRDDLDVELAELYPERPADEARLAEIRAKLFAEPEPRGRWMGAAAAALVVLLISGIVVFFQLPKTEPALTVTQSLNEAADRLDATPATSGAHRHVAWHIWNARTVDVAVGRWYAYTEEFVVEVWIPAAGGEQVRESRRPTGQVRWLGGTEPESVLASRPNSEVPESLPTQACTVTPCPRPDVNHDPVEWLRKFRADKGSEPHGAFSQAMTTLNDPFATKDDQAAVYRQLALVPGVRYSGDWIVVDSQLGGGTLRLRVDQATGRYLGFEQLVEMPSRLPAGTVLQSVEITVDAEPPR